MSADFRVYKFGGASVKDAEAVRNVAGIVTRHGAEPLVVVASAMGKTTNALEEVVAAVVSSDKEAAERALTRVEDFHRAVLEGLFPKNHTIVAQVEDLFRALRDEARLPEGERYGKTYDRLVRYGELISTRIIHAHLCDNHLDCHWHNAQELLVTNGHFRRATVDFDTTVRRVREAIRPQGIHIIQGFIGATAEGLPTTLGREGSDYTAAVLAYALDAVEVCIWKDVPGVLSGDPKVFDNVVRLESISYREAIELAYYGASVIHPKTIQPLQRKEIPLNVRSFVDPDSPGTYIRKGEPLVPMTPCFIRKGEQALITLSTGDLAFIVEDHLSLIYKIFHDIGISVNLMQNSAVSSSFCINHDPVLLPRLLTELKNYFDVRHNENMTLYTIRHYDAHSVDAIALRGELFLEQITRHTRQMVLREVVSGF